MLAYFHHTPYDLVFVCDHNEVAIDDDGERYTNEKLQDEIYKRILSILSAAKSKYIMLKGSVLERVKKVVEYADIKRENS